MRPNERPARRSLFAELDMVTREPLYCQHTSLGHEPQRESKRNAPILRVCAHRDCSPLPMQLHASCAAPQDKGGLSLAAVDGDVRVRRKVDVQERALVEIR